GQELVTEASYTDVTVSVACCRRLRFDDLCVGRWGKWNLRLRSVSEVHMAARRATPPLKALATLECVVRHRSVSLAAEELCVTHAGVSKQLTGFAVWLGRPLFADIHRRMVPTLAALRLAQGVELGLRSIHEALDEICGVTGPEPQLRVIAPATLAMYWLIP